MHFHNDAFPTWQAYPGPTEFSVVDFEWSKKRRYYEEDCEQVWEDEPVIDLKSLKISDVRDSETNNLILEEPLHRNVLAEIVERIHLMDIEELEEHSSDEYYEEVF